MAEVLAKRAVQVQTKMAPPESSAGEKLYENVKTSITRFGRTRALIILIIAIWALHAWRYTSNESRSLAE